jgi:hypothetical protein
MRAQNHTCLRVRDLGNLVQIIRSSGGDPSESELLGHASTQSHTDDVHELLTCVQSELLGQELVVSQRSGSSWHNRDLSKRAVSVMVTTFTHVVVIMTAFTHVVVIMTAFTHVVVIMTACTHVVVIMTACTHVVVIMTACTHVVVIMTACTHVVVIMTACTHVSVMRRT